jgi:hypothetical protein
MRVGGVWVGREGIKKLCVGDEGEIRRNMDAGVVNMKERI